MKTIAATLLLIMAVEVGGEPASATEHSFHASAFDLESGALVYVEEHREIYRAGRPYRSEVVYRAEGDTIATKAVRFGERPSSPDFSLVDRRDGYMEGAQTRGDSLVMSRRWRDGERHEVRVLDAAGAAVVDGGFDHAVRRAWPELMGGDHVTFDFAVPNKLRSYRFRIRKTGEGRHESRPAVLLRIEPANFFVRLIAPHIDLTYDRESRRLLKYVGISNLANSDTGKRYRVRIEFTYPQRLLAGPANGAAGGGRSYADPGGAL